MTQLRAMIEKERFNIESYLEMLELEDIKWYEAFGVKRYVERILTEINIYKELIDEYMEALENGMREFQDLHSFVELRVQEYTNYLLLIIGSLALFGVLNSFLPPIPSLIVTLAFGAGFLWLLLTLAKRTLKHVFER